MRGGLLTKVLVGFFVGLVVVLAGCCINIGSCGWPQVKYERTEQLSAGLESGSVLSVESRNGSIAVTGAEVSDCSVIATIKARAGSEEEAKKLAEETKIRLEPFGRKLTVKIERPAMVSNESVAVNFDITVPKQTSVELVSRNGKVAVSQINGSINAKTRNGSVSVRGTSGDMQIETRNGSVSVGETFGNIQIDTRNGKVVCEDICGDVEVSSRNGKTRVGYSKTAPPVCNVRIVSRNGGIEFTPPANFSASVEVSTRNGSVYTDLPITVTVVGKISKGKLVGTIGGGEGKLYLETRNGSIKIKE